MGTFSLLGSLKGYGLIENLVAADDGYIYAASGFSYACPGGAILRMGRTGALVALTTFLSQNDMGPNALVAGKDGNFYGTTPRDYRGFGTIFKMTPAGVTTVLAAFNGRNGISYENQTPSAFPTSSGLIQGSDGALYGTTSYGGATYRFQANLGKGTIYKITPQGAMTTLVSFKGANGAIPLSGLTEGLDGNFYGTTLEGGKSNHGTIFKVTPSGGLTTLYSFPSLGFDTRTALIASRDGNLYGLTTFGVFYRLTPGGAFISFPKPSWLYSFVSGFLQAPDGNFYGTTFTVNPLAFKLTPQGDWTNLSYLNSNQSDLGPKAGMILGRDGNFYGTTLGDDFYQDSIVYNAGTVFRLSPQGVLTTLLEFDGHQGSHPGCGLVQGLDGNIYGATGPDIVGVSPIFEIALKPPQAQTVSFAELIEGEVGQIQGLKASSSSGLPVTYRVLSGSAKIVGDEVVFTGAGVVRIAAEQVGNGNYKSASEVHSVRVDKHAQVLAPFAAIPAQTYPGTFTLTPPVSDSGLSVTVTVKSGPATISGNTLTFTGTGRVTLAADQPGDANFHPARTVATSFQVVAP